MPDQVLDWERSIQLHQEMALALDPTVGNEEAAALANEVDQFSASWPFHHPLTWIYIHVHM